MHFSYYNEFDPKAAAWIQQLIDDKQIPYGYVDSRSILEVEPSDLRGFTQCHFFAGVGGWSLALKLAGWHPSRPIWTASLPCQPFSTAGAQLGLDDERHLAPTFLSLVKQCRPPVCVGEQVASKLARTQWLPGIRVEFEALGYSFVPVDLCAPCAGEIGEGRIVRGDSESWERIIIGHPHIRQRLYWVADADSERRSGIDSLLRTQGSRRSGAGEVLEATGRGTVSPHVRVAHPIDGGRQERWSQAGRALPEVARRGGEVTDFGAEASESGRASHLLLPCRDGKTRRTQSGIFPLVDGIPRGVVPSGDPSDPSYANDKAEARAMRLKGYGNALQIDTAVLFIRSYMEAADA